MLIVEQGRTPKSGDIVIASVDNEFTVKRYVTMGRKAYLMPENKNYKPIKMGSSVRIHSVVVGSFRRYS
jgi:DNA polymerase V